MEDDFGSSCPGYNMPPSIYVDPRYVSSEAITTLDVTLDFADSDGLNSGSLSIKLNGQTQSWTYTASNNGRSGQASGTLTLQSGVNTLQVTICDSSTGQLCSTEQVSYYSEMGTAAPRAVPSVSTAPHHPAFRDVSQGSAMLSYTTPAYVSRDQPRAATLLYASGQAKPMGFVQVDVSDNSTDTPALLSIQVRDTATGASVAPETYYSFTAGTKTYRLAATWDASSQSTGAYEYDVVVRTYWSDGSFKEAAPARVRVLVVNEGANPARFGRGWSLAGLQRVHPDGGGGALVTEGDGTAWFFEPDACNGSACTYQSPDGDFTTLTSASGVYRRAYPDGSVVQFGANDHIEYAEDRFGNRTSFAYDTYDRLTSITDPAGKAITFAYANGGGRISSISTPGGRSTSIALDSLFQVESVTEPNSSYALSNIVYHASSLLHTWDDAAGGDWSVGYDLVSYTMSSYSTPSVTVGGTQKRLLTRLVSREAAVLPATGEGTQSNPAPAVYPSSARAQVTDPNSATVSALVDRFGLPTQVTPPFGATTRISRNEDGLPTRIDAESGITLYTWDERGLMESQMVVGDSKTTTIDYDSVGTHTWLPVAVSAGQVTTHYRYGTKGELLRTWSGGAVDSTSATTVIYDTSYRPTRITDEDGHGSVIVYSASGWQNTDHVDSYGTGPTQRTTFVYDAYGRAIRARSLQGDSTVTAYDVLNRVTSERDPLGRTISYVYTGPFLTRVTDAAGKHYDYGYNVLGWLTSEKRPGNANTIVYAYDAAGNVASRTDRRGKTVSMTYDDLGRVITRAADGDTTTYGFDSLHWPLRWRSARNSVSTDTIFYDDKGRPEREVTVLGGQTYDRTFEYQYEGMRTQMAMTSPWADTLSLGYIVDGRIRRNVITDLDGEQSTFGYDSEGLPYSVSYQTTYPLTAYTARDARHLPIAQTFSIGSVDAALGADYAYDHYARLTQRTGHGDPEFLNTGRIFSYDASGRLTGFTDEEYQESPFGCGEFDLGCEPPVDTTVVRTVTFGYDAAGNRTDSNASLVSGSNRYSSFDGYTLGYDAEGNLTSKSGGGVTRTYTWNALGQLASVTSNGSTVSFAYDGWDRRVRRIKGGVTTYQLYDGDDILAEVNSSGSPIRRYTHLSGVDRPFALHTGGQTYYYVQDVSGNVTGLVGSDGLLDNTYEYAPFGELLSVNEGVANPLRYKGREWDADVGLYYMRARWYDPELGRFVSEDPIGIAGGINLMTFAVNDPVNFGDPWGLDDCRLVAVLDGAGDLHRIYQCWLGEEEPEWPFSTSRESGESNPISSRGCCYSYSGLSDSERIFLGVGARLKPVQPILEGAAVGAIAAPVAIMAAGELSLSVAAFQGEFNAVGSQLVRMQQAPRIRALFGKGSLLNSGPRWRIGFQTFKGRHVFRASGDWVTRAYERGLINPKVWVENHWIIRNWGRPF